MSTTDLGTDRSVPPPTRRSGTSSLRPLVLRLHFYAGLLVAPFILIAAVSGGLYALAPTIEQLVYRDQLHTKLAAVRRDLRQVDWEGTVEPLLARSMVLLSALLRVFGPIASALHLFDPIIRRISGSDSQ
ncbi:MAG: PepSY domain-containing protein, partial [Rhodococcus ruber]|nr:PepSY domain-containing protein [Rhodococcus ruber]